MSIEDISKEKMLREDKLKESNKSNINESFLSIFSYKMKRSSTRSSDLQLMKKSEMKSKDINFDTTHNELIRDKKENITKELKILDYQLEIIRLKRDIATINGIGTISSSEQQAIDNKYAKTCEIKKKIKRPWKAIKKN